MFKVLDYSVEFPTTGRQFAKRIEFAPGLTSVTGRNEAGKSLIVEMLRYCLFGKAALRGAASDYRNLTASLTLNVGKKQVAISRTRRREVVTVDGVEKAVGADALNRYIPNELLGFGLDVFDIACGAMQGDLGALTEMKPTARRAMVDQLVGLDRLEVVERDCRNEARAQSQLAETLNLSVNEPQQPVEPDNYRPSVELTDEVTRLVEAQNLRQRLLQVREPVRPVEPTPVEGDLAELEKRQANRQLLLQDLARVQGQLAAIPELKVEPEDLERAVKYRDYAREVQRRGPYPQYTADQLDRMEADWTIIDRQSHDDLVTCPECDHQFDPRTGEAKIELPEEPPLVRTEIYRERQAVDAWAEPLEEVEAFEVDDLDNQLRAYENRNLREDLLRRLDVKVPDDLSDQLRAVRQYQQQRAVYESEMLRYETDRAAWEQSQCLLAQTEDRSVELENLRVQLVQARDYEQAVQRYETQLEHYEHVAKQVHEAREKSDGFLRGSRALAATRVAVKAELAPSLSVAASSLLASMTGGERRSIVVDQDFEVTVDNQPLRTLSGSGKSVVNLALRIGMGQVLTSRVLPVFLGDEINADMDADRAGTTQETMMALREYLTQIIIITHRDIEADHKIEL